MTSLREVQEGLQVIGEEERVVFTLDTDLVGGSPSAVEVVATLTRDWSDITDEIFPVNSPTAASDVITLSPFVASADYKGETIRVQVKFTSQGNVLEHFFRVRVDS